MKLSIGSRHLMFAVAFPLAVLGTSCGQAAVNPTPPDGAVDYGVVMRLRDMTTNYPSMPRDTDEEGLHFTFQTVYPNMELEEFERTHLAAWQRSIRVVTWPEGGPVAGRWEVRTEPWQIVFVQDAPFAERWYAMQINLTTLPASLGIWHDERPERGTGDHSVDDGWVTSRFRVGSQPVVRLSGVWDNGGGGFGLHISEPVFSAHAIDTSDALQVTVGERRIDCEPSVPMIEAGESVALTWECHGEVQPSEAIAATLNVDGLTSAEGVPARFCGEGSPPRWVSEPGIEGDYQALLPSLRCADATFLRDGL